MLTDMRLNQLFLAGAYFTAFVLMLCSLTYFFVVQGHVRLFLEALLALPVGVLILWLLRSIFCNSEYCEARDNTDADDEDDPYFYGK